MRRSVLALALLALLPACAIAEEAPPAPKPQVMCTMDAKICPDGTGVGRTGPDCEFALCPGEKVEDKEAPERAPERKKED